MACAWLPYRLVGGGNDTVDHLRAELERTRSEAAELEVNNAILARDIAALRTDPRAIEDVARRDLGLVKPGEIILRIERDAAEETR